MPKAKAKQPGKRPAAKGTMKQQFDRMKRRDVKIGEKSYPVHPKKGFTSTSFEEIKARKRPSAKRQPRKVFEALPQEQEDDNTASAQMPVQPRGEHAGVAGRIQKRQPKRTPKRVIIAPKRKA